MAGNFAYGVRGLLDHGLLAPSQRPSSATTSRHRSVRSCEVDIKTLGGLQHRREPRSDAYHSLNHTNAYDRPYVRSVDQETNVAVDAC